jgi:hypothetical protein
MEDPSGLRLEFADGHVRLISSIFLEADLAPDGKTVDLYYGTCSIRVMGTGLRAILTGLESSSAPGRLAAISERPDAVSEPSPVACDQADQVTVSKILYSAKLEAPVFDDVPDDDPVPSL